MHYLRLKLHTFVDNTNYVQAASTDEETEFLNYDTILSPTNLNNLGKIMIRLQFSIVNKKMMHFRKVYSMLDLLGDFGGLFGSIFILG